MDPNDETKRMVEQAVAKTAARTVARTVAKSVAIGIALLFGFLVFIAVGGVVVRWLWNWLVPSVFGLRPVTFWEALGLLALGRILFGGFGMGGGQQYHGGGGRKDWWKKAPDKAPSPPVGQE